MGNFSSIGENFGKIQGKKVVTLVWEAADIGFFKERFFGPAKGDSPIPKMLKNTT